MATSTADPAPLARAAVRRYYPRQEPSAVVPHAGICAGGGRQRPSLPQPILAAPRHRMRRPCPIGRNPKGSPCGCPADRPWTGPTAPRRPRSIGGSSLRRLGVLALFAGGVLEQEVDLAGRVRFVGGLAADREQALAAEARNADRIGAEGAVV